MRKGRLHLIYRQPQGEPADAPAGARLWRILPTLENFTAVLVTEDGERVEVDGLGEIVMTASPGNAFEARLSFLDFALEESEEAAP